jgi:hypothetical protein
VGQNEVRPAAHPAARKSVEAIPWPANDRLPVKPGEATHPPSPGTESTVPVPPSAPETGETDDAEARPKKGLFGRFRGG